MQATTTFKHFTPLRERNIKIKIINQNSLHLENSIGNPSVHQVSKLNQSHIQASAQHNRFPQQNSADNEDQQYKNKRSVSQYMNTEIAENKQNSAIYLKTEQPNLNDYYATQDVNQFRIKKQTPLKGKRPKSSMGGLKHDQNQKLVTRQSILNTYISTQYGQLGGREGQQSIVNLKKSKSKKRNEKSQKLLILYQNYDGFNGNKSALEYEKKSAEPKKIRQSDGFFVRQQGINKKFIFDTENQVHEIEKLLLIIDDRYQQKSDSLDVILNEVDMLDKKIKLIERQIRSLYSTNTEHDVVLKIQQILFVIKNLQIKIKSYYNLREQQNQQAFDQQPDNQNLAQSQYLMNYVTQSQNIMNNNSNHQKNSYINNSQPQMHQRAQSQQYQRQSQQESRLSLHQEKQSMFAEYVFDKFNNTIKLISNLKKSQVYEAFDLILQLNQELHKISNSQDVSYNLRAQALQDLYELDCQVPLIFNLLIKILNNEKDCEESINQELSVNKSQVSMDKSKEVKSNQFTIESPTTSQKSFMRQTMLKSNQNQMSKNDSYIQIGQDQLDSSIQHYENESSQTHQKHPMRTNSKIFKDSNGFYKQRQPNLSQDNKSSKSLIDQVKGSTKKINTISGNSISQKLFQNDYGTIYSNKMHQNNSQTHNNSKKSIKESSNIDSKNNSLIKQDYGSINNSKIDEVKSLNELSQQNNNADNLNNNSEVKSSNQQSIIQSNDNRQQQNDEKQIIENSLLQSNINQEKQSSIEMANQNSKQPNENLNGLGIKSKSHYIQIERSKNEDLVQSKSEQGNLLKQDTFRPQQEDQKEEKVEQLDNNEINNNRIKEFMQQIRVLIDHQNIEYTQQIIKQLIEFMQKSEFSEKQKIIDILTQSQQQFIEMLNIQSQVNQIQIQYDQFFIDSEMYWNALHFTHTHKQTLIEFRQKLYSLFQISHLYKDDIKLQQEIKDFQELRQVVLKLADKTDFPLLNIALPNNLNVSENVINDLKQRRFQTIEVIKEIIETISQITNICHRRTFTIYKLIAFSNSFYTHSDRILSLLNASTTPHLTLLNLLEIYNKLKKLFQRDKSVSKLKQIVDRLLFIRLYDELVSKNFKQIEQEVVNSIQRGDIKLRVIEQRLKRLFSSTNEIRIILLDNNFDFNRIDNFRQLVNQYVQLSTLYSSIYNTNESSFVSGRDQAFELIEQLYSFMFFTKSLSNNPYNQGRSKSPLGQSNNFHQQTQINQSSDAYYYYHIKKIPHQAIKEIRKRIEVYLQQLSLSQEKLQNFINQHQQQLQQQIQERKSITQEQQEQPPHIKVKEIFQKRLSDLNEQKSHLIQQITQLLQKSSIQVIDVLQVVQGITEYLIEKKEDIAIVQNNLDQTIFTMPFNFGADCQMILQQISNFMHHNSQQNITESMRTLTISSSNTDLSAPNGPILFNYSSSNSNQNQQQQITSYFYILNNYISDSFCVGEIQIQSLIDGQTIYSNQVDTSLSTVKLSFNTYHPYLIVNVKFADYKVKQAVLFASDISTLEFSKKDLISNEKIYKVIIQATDPTSILRESLQFFIHAKSNTQNEYIINKEINDHNNFVTKEIQILPTNEIITLTIRQNNQFEYTLYTNLIMSDTFQVFKNGKVAINQINITQIRQDNPHSWKVFQIPKLKTKSAAIKK